MKQFTIGIFGTREDAEEAINHVHREFDVPTDDISYVYRNDEGEVQEVDADDVSSGTPGEGAKTGAAWGGGIGAALGLATAVGMIPVIGPVFAAGPLVAALGITGTVGATAAGAVTGAAAGGLVGALVNWGVSEEKAQEYADHVSAGNILVAVHAEPEHDVVGIMEQHNVVDVAIYEPSV